MNYDAIRDTGTEPKIVFTFHGTGAEADQLHGLARTFLPGHHVVSPAAPDGDGFVNGAGVAEGDVAGMADFIEAEIERTGAVHATGLGLSGGADILAATAIARPDLFDTLALMHPGVPSVPPTRPDLAMTRVLITAGKQDPRCPPDLMQGFADWLTAQKVDCLLAWHPGGAEVPQSEVEALRDFLT